MLLRLRSNPSPPLSRRSRLAFPRTRRLPARLHSMAHAITCDCGVCSVCRHRVYQQRSRTRYRTLVAADLGESPIATTEGVFALRSQWEAVEAWCWRMFGPPVASVSADIGTREMTENPSYLQRRYRATKNRHHLRKHPMWGYPWKR